MHITPGRFRASASPRTRICLSLRPIPPPGRPCAGGLLKGLTLFAGDGDVHGGGRIGMYIPAPWPLPRRCRTQRCRRGPGKLSFYRLKPFPFQGRASLACKDLQYCGDRVPTMTLTPALCSILERIVSRWGQLLASALGQWVQILLHTLQ